MQTFAELKELPWYTYTENNEKTVMSTMLKDMFIDFLENTEFCQFFRIPMTEEWFFEVIKNENSLFFLPTKSVNGISKMQMVTKEEVADSVLKKMKDPNWIETNAFHYKMLSLVE